MLALFKDLTISQYEAALLTLGNCIDECPEDLWFGKIANHSFNVSAFHAIFFADVYLGKSLEELKAQDFHNRYAADFDGYEELSNDPPVNIYRKAFVKEYLDFCHSKAVFVVANETAESLKRQSAIPWQKLTRAELHVYNIRHIQHHAAQLVLRLRLDSDVDIDWL